MQAITRTHHSVGKALEILKLFIPDNQERSTVGVARDLDLNVSTVSRLLNALTVHNFLQQNTRTKKFSLGKASLDLGKAVDKSINEQIVLMAKPHIDSLRDSLDIHGGLEILLGKNAVLIYRAISQRRLDVGPLPPEPKILPVHVTAGARAIMAFSPTKVVDLLLKNKFNRLTSSTITDRSILKKKLSEFKEMGVSFDRGESNPYCTYIGAPVFNHEKLPIAAVVVWDSNKRIKGAFEKEVIEALKETAAKISAELFYSVNNS
jgi:DNA-binding IclR family transcriptional regulator